MDRADSAVSAPLITVLVTPRELVQQEITVTGATHHHLFRSRRSLVGDRLRLADGAGVARWGRVESVGRREARIAVGDPAPSHEANRRVELLLALPRGSRAAWAVEKATEVGVAAIRWLASHRAPRELGPAALERQERVAQAALEQSHRSRLPELSGIHAWGELPGLVEGFDERYRLDPGAPRAALERPPGGSAVVVVGPEGGWTESEVRELEALGCQGVHLGSTILRIETAAILGAAWALGSIDTRSGGT
jgi:16S rRNA (uracil1498-N3)-methyltransferase